MSAAQAGSAAGVAVRDVALPLVGPKASPISGTPVEHDLVLFDDGRTEYGIWEVTPGVWDSRSDGRHEQFHVVSGAGRLEGADGETTPLAPGVVVVVPDGWTGRWVVTDTLRKTYAITRTGDVG
jgi:uncharacterized cupin superfamily protein